MGECIYGGGACKTPLGCLQERSQNTACRAASPRRNEGVTGNENPGCLSSSSSSSSSEIEYEDDDEDDPSRQLEVIGKKTGVRIIGHVAHERVTILNTGF
jgi:hypothetical protein